MPATISKAVTFTFPVELIEQLDELPARQKSSFVQQAVAEKMRQEKLRLALVKLDRFRKKHGCCTEQEIVRMIRQDRRSH